MGLLGLNFLSLVQRFPLFGGPLREVPVYILAGYIAHQVRSPELCREHTYVPDGRVWVTVQTTQQEHHLHKSAIDMKHTINKHTHTHTSTLHTVF